MDASLPAPVVARTDALHPDGQYGTLAKLFHWTTVLLIAVALPVGFVIKHIKDDDQMAFYAIHESAGLTVFFVVILRLLWRRLSPPPALPGHVPAVMRAVANGVHHALYALLILQPLLGFFATNAQGYPLQGETAYFRLIDLPKFMEANAWLGGWLQGIHTVFGWALLVLLAAHIGGALFHHLIRRDGSLLRML
ncbi:MAG TPA: cytochrome b [Roseomonas sp.]|jgi:cytochrome b561